MVGVGGWFNTHALESKTLKETDDWKIVRNGNGATHRWWKKASGTPEHLEFEMCKRSVWDEKFRPHLLGDHRKRIGDLSGIKASLEKQRDKGRWTTMGNSFIWELLRSSLGDENMFMTMATDPEWIHDFNRVYTDLYKVCFSILFEEGGLPDGVWVYEDLGYRDRLFCSVGMLEELIFPYYEELVDVFHGYDLPVVLHSCGYQEPMIPLAVKAGFDALNPMEVKAGNDILKYAELYRDDLCFVGGLDAMVLESGDQALIKKEVTRLVVGMRERGARFIYGSDHSLSPNISYADYQLSLETYRSVMANG